MASKQHTLVDSVKFWLILVVPGKTGRQYQIEEIGNATTVEQLYKFYLNMPNVSDLEDVNGKRASVALFKNSIKPAWEDPENAQGCTATFISSNPASPDLINRLWLDAVLSIAGKLVQILSTELLFCGKRWDIF